MMKIRFTVREQTLRRTDNKPVAGNSIGFLRAGFEFDESWAGLTKTAVFETADGTAYDVILGTQQICECEVAHEVLETSEPDGGFFFVSVRGVDALSDIAVRGTANRVCVEVEASGAVQGENSVPATPSEAEQLCALLAQGKWLSGTAVSSTGTEIEAEVDGAAVGVHYLNTGSGNVYLCTAVDGTASTWDRVMTLKGEQGDRGERGLQGEGVKGVGDPDQLFYWLNEITQPAYCLFTATVSISSPSPKTFFKGDIYQAVPMSGVGGMTRQLNITGEKGDPGADGVPGDKGDKGDKGDRGEDGIGAFYTQEAIRSYINTLPAETTVYFLYVGASNAIIRNGSDAIQYTIHKGDVTKLTTNTTTGWRNAFAEKAYSIIGDKGDKGENGVNAMLCGDVSDIEDIYDEYGTGRYSVCWTGEETTYTHYAPGVPVPVETQTTLVPYELYVVEISVYGNIVTYSFSDMGNIKGAPADTNDYAFALPPKIYTRVGKPIRLHLRNLVNDNYHINWGVYTAFADIRTYDDYIEITPISAGQKNVSYHIYDSHHDEVESGTTQLVVSSSAPNDQTVLLIGDSTVEESNMLPTYLWNCFDSDGKTVTLLGHKGTGNYKHEGYSGWKLTDFMNASKSSVTNPFYDPEGQTFDFSYYMAQQGYSSVDKVVIQLGTNDASASEVGQDLTGSLDALETMISSIHSFNANIRILIDLPMMPTLICEKFAEKYQGTGFDWVLRANEQRLNKAIVDTYRDVSYITLVCTNAILEGTKDICDNVHPTPDGYKKIAEQIYHTIMGM